MAYKILILSPLHNMGSTIATLIMAQIATYTNKTTCVTYTDPTSNLPQYIGVRNIKDPTRSIMQIVRLIDNGALADDDILDYAFQYAENAYLIGTSDLSLSRSDREQILQHIFDRAPTTLSLCDCSHDLEDELTQKLIEKTDAIFICVSMSMKSTERIKQWLDHPLLKNRREVYVLVNRYNEVINAVRNYSKVIQYPTTKICKLHYNPWIEKMCNRYELHTVVPKIRNLDPRVASLNNDLVEIMRAIDTGIMRTTTGGF